MSNIIIKDLDHIEDAARDFIDRRIIRRERRAGLAARETADVLFLR